jgi:hypothetical protein
VEDDDTMGGGAMPSGGNWRPVEDVDGPKLYIQAGSKMNEKQFDDEETPF